MIPPAIGRVVALGASNLTRGLQTVVATATATWGPDVEVLAALGHGRSYGAPSRLLIRTLPGILESGLWKDLESLAAGADPRPRDGRRQRHPVRLFRRANPRMGRRGTRAPGAADQRPGRDRPPLGEHQEPHEPEVPLVPLDPGSFVSLVACRDRREGRARKRRPRRSGGGTWCEAVPLEGRVVWVRSHPHPAFSLGTSVARDPRQPMLYLQREPLSPGGPPALSRASRTAVAVRSRVAHATIRAATTFRRSRVALLGSAGRVGPVEARPAYVPSESGASVRP